MTTLPQLAWPLQQVKGPDQPGGLGGGGGDGGLQRRRGKTRQLSASIHSLAASCTSQRTWAEAAGSEAEDSAVEAVAAAGSEAEGSEEVAMEAAAAARAAAD